jgi:hypothetical protein
MGNHEDRIRRLAAEFFAESTSYAPALNVYAFAFLDKDQRRGTYISGGGNGDRLSVIADLVRQYTTMHNLNMDEVLATIKTMTEEDQLHWDVPPVGGLDAVPLVRMRIESVRSSGHRVGWTKHVTRINKEAKAGYVFEGEFLNDGTLYDLKPGSVLVQKRPAGSVRDNRWEGWVMKLCPDGTFEGIACGDWFKDHLRLRDAAAEALAEKGVD